MGATRHSINLFGEGRATSANLHTHCFVHAVVESNGKRGDQLETVFHVRTRPTGAQSTTDPVERKERRTSVLTTIESVFLVYFWLIYLLLFCIFCE
jgi:hypothetical protein